MAHKNDSNFSPYKARRKAPSRLEGKHQKPEKIFGVEEASDRILDVFKNHEFELEISHAQRRQLAQFYVLLMENQEHQNFTRLLKIKDISIKHFIDCLIIKQLTTLQFPLIDVGTGPGFPGIPLKVLYPSERIVLAEGVQKRVEFLKQVRSELNFTQLDIWGRNVNRFAFFPARGVITRAVEDINNTLNNCVNCLDIGGRVYLMKGPGVDPEIEMAKSNQDFKLIEDHAYTLPKTPHERRLVVYEKIRATVLPDEDDSHLYMDELSADEKKRWSQYS